MEEEFESDTDRVEETEKEEESLRENEVTPSPSYMNADWDMHRMFFE